MFASGKKAVGGVGPFTSRWHVSRSTTQGIPYNVSTLLEFDDVHYDNDDEYDDTTNYDITIAASGLYHLAAHVEIGSLADGEGPQLWIKVNGVKVLSDVFKVGGIGKSGVHAEGDVELTTGDLVTVEVLRTKDVGDKQTGTGPECCFSGHRIGSFASRWHVDRSVVQATAQSAWTQIEYDNVLYDNDSEYDNVTNFDVTIKASGFYHLTVNFQLSAMLDGDRPYVVIKKNGTVIANDLAYVGGAGVNGAHAECDVQLTIGDVLTVEGVHAMGGVKNTKTDYGCSFSGYRFA